MASGITNFDTVVSAVEGYAESLSYGAGDDVVFCCSSRVSSFSAEVARIGATREIVWQRGAIAGEEQPAPPDAYANGCGWHESFRFTVPAAWRSGYYEVVLRADGVPVPEGESHAFFVVRSANPGRHRS